MPSADSLTWDLARHGALEVVAGCSALMLLPENCTSADRLLALSRTALDLPSTGERSVEHIRWGRWLLDSPSLNSGFPFDPPEGLFSCPVAFFGGSYTVFTGGEPEPPFALQLLLDVLALADWPESARDFRSSAVRLHVLPALYAAGWTDDQIREQLRQKLIISWLLSRLLAMQSIESSCRFHRRLRAIGLNSTGTLPQVSSH
jgi:hypothetical protein